MSLVFYYSPMSSAVTVHQALEELGIPYEKVRIDIQARDQDKPAFRAINPNGKVPVIVHDGTPIFESVAILIHLGETFGEKKGLFPKPGIERALVTQWLVWVNVSLGEALSRHQHASSERIPVDHHNAKAAAKAKDDVENLLGILDRALEGKDYLVGNRFTFADLQVSGWLGYLGMCGCDTTKWKNASAWMKRCSERPAYATAMKP
jgi:glutathione S-transferase